LHYCWGFGAKRSSPDLSPTNYVTTGKSLKLLSLTSSRKMEIIRLQWTSGSATVRCLFVPLLPTSHLCRSAMSHESVVSNKVSILCSKNIMASFQRIEMWKTKLPYVIEVWNSGVAYLPAGGNHKHHAIGWQCLQRLNTYIHMDLEILLLHISTQGMPIQWRMNSGLQCNLYLVLRTEFLQL
jgi:hypothetical protein